MAIKVEDFSVEVKDENTIIIWFQKTYKAYSIIRRRDGWYVGTWIAGRDGSRKGHPTVLGACKSYFRGALLAKVSEAVANARLENA